MLERFKGQRRGKLQFSSSSRGMSVSRSPSADERIHWRVNKEQRDGAHCAYDEPAEGRGIRVKQIMGIIEITAGSSSCSVYTAKRSN
jgi:hypothetical protein